MTEKELLELREEVSKTRDFYAVSDEFVANLVYNSLSFEHGMGSLDQVESILKGDTERCNPTYVTLVLNIKRALDFTLELARSGAELTEDALKDLHQILMNDVNRGGLYRNVDISIKGSNHTPCSHIKVYDRMKKYFDTMKDREPSLETIAYSHLQLAKIHPFLDGNGRCARLVMNYHLLKAGYAPVTIPIERKHEYFACLEAFKVEKDITPFINFLSELEETALRG